MLRFYGNKTIFYIKDGVDDDPKIVYNFKLCTKNENHFVVGKQAQSTAACSNYFASSIFKRRWAVGMEI